MDTTSALTQPAPSTSQLQCSLASLVTASHILDGFAHRNKNQHRATKWWGPFDMLRRSLHKILPDLEDAVSRAEMLASISSANISSKGKRKRAGAAAENANKARQPELNKVIERATWIRIAVAHKAYEVFTQLAADRQFAQLGLVLIGVLAQVETAISPLAREVSPLSEAAAEVPVESLHSATGSNVDADMLGEAVPREAAVSSPPKAVFEDTRLDLGVAVSRSEIEAGIISSNKSRRVAENQPSKEGDSSPIARPPVTRQERKPEDRKKPKKVKAKADVEADAEAPNTKDETRLQKNLGVLKDSKKVKKKRKKTGGDEFDDLFSTLL